MTKSVMTDPLYSFFLNLVYSILYGQHVQSVEVQKRCTHMPKRLAFFNVDIKETETFKTS